MKIFLTIILQLIAIQLILAQSADSLKMQLNLQTNAEGKLDILLELTELYLVSQTDSAMHYCDEAITLSKDNGLITEYANATRLKGNIYFRKGFLNEAIATYRSLIPLLEEQKQTLLLGKIYNNLGYVYQTMSNQTEAIECLKKALEIYESCNEELLQTGPLINLGMLYYRMGDYNKSISLYNIAYKLAVDNNHPLTIANVLNNLGVVYLEWGRYQLALETYQSALDYRKMINDRDGEASAYNNIGEVYYTIGDYPKAFEYLNKALAIRHEIGASAMIPSSLNKLGELYNKWGKYQLALDYYTEAMEVVEQEEDQYMLGCTLLGMADVYRNTELINKAVDLTNESVKIFEQIENKREMAMGYIMLAELNFNYLNEFSKAESYFLQAEKIINDIGVSPLLPEFYQKKAKFLRDRGAYNESIELLNKSNSILPGNKYILAQNYSILADLYKKTDNSKQAALALSMTLAYNDSIASEKTKFQKISDEDSYFSQVKEKENVRLKEQKRQIELIAERKNRVLMLFVIFIITLIITLGVIVIVNKRLSKANQKLILQRLEIESQRDQLQQANSKLVEIKLIEDEVAIFRRKFLNNLGHELKGPVNNILSLAKTIQESNCDPKVNHTLDNMLVHCNFLNSFTSDMIDFSKIENGKLVLELINFDPVNVIESALSSVKIKSKEKNISIEKNILPSIPRLLTGDAFRLDQIVQILIRNAIQFSDNDQKINLNISGIADGNKFLLKVEVKDQGVGIDEEILPDIFESYNILNDDVSQIYGGTGLGLVLVKKLIELHKGRIWVESTLNNGAVFTFEIPYEIMNSKFTDQPKMPRKSKETDHIRILLAEDNEINQEITTDVIKAWGSNFEVDIAQNGRIAVNKLEEVDYDCVLMDIQMPEMDGHEATIYIRKQLPKPVCNIPIIGVTAHAFASEKATALKNGMNDYITKPFNVDELKQKILYFVFERKE